MKTRTRFSGVVAAAAPEVEEQEPERFDASRLEDQVLAEAVALAREPIKLDEEPVIAAAAPAGLSSEAYGLAVAAIRETHLKSTEAITALAASVVPQPKPDDQSLVIERAFEVMSKLADRPLPQAPDLHVHTPRHDLHVDVSQPEFSPEITVEGAKIDVEVPERETRIDVHVPEQEAPQVHVAAAAPEIVVRAAESPAPVVNVAVPNEIRTIPAEVETVAERDDQDLIVRSVTRPTGG